LDCACGSGVLVIDLIKKGYRISCSDGSKDMIEAFMAKAQKIGLNIKPSHLLWSELPNIFYNMFDLVMCRGNSLVYANLWDNEKTITANNYREIEQSINGMYHCLKPGGTLYVDIPAEDSCNLSNEIKHPITYFEDKQVEILEKIIPDNKKGLREWSVELTIDGKKHEIKRYSYLLPHNKFLSILTESGFKKINKCEIGGERPHYSVFIAEK
jgi:SAM-dependent methyltransferase